MDIEEVAAETYRFETPFAEIERPLTAYLIREEKTVLIDPGPAATIPFIQEAFRNLGVRELSYIIPTHIHVDHAGAAGRLTQLFPESKVVLHPSSVRHATDPTRLIQSTKMAFGDNFESIWGAILPVPEPRMKVPEDGEKLSIGSREVRIIYSPGHAPHHIAIFDEKTGGLFCGEALGVPKRGASSFPLPAVVPPGFDIEEYLNTMERLRTLKPRLLFYGHDGVGREPEKLISVAVENTRLFGELVLKALKAGESAKEIGSKIHEFTRVRAGVPAEETDRTMTVDAYTMYFKKKGLI